MPTDVLKKLGDTAKDIGSKLKSLPPNEGEQQSLKEKQSQIDALSAKPTPEKPKETEPAEVDKVAPLARYGSRPGEKRIDTSDMTKPLGTSAPVYDKGGDVSVEASKRLQSSGDAGLQSRLAEPDEQVASKAKAAPAASEGGGFSGLAAYGKQQYNIGKDTAKEGEAQAAPSAMPRTAEQKAAGIPMEKAPKMPVIPINTSAAPVFDEGGDVDVNDGKHQVAVLQDGEKVLTPEEAAKYKEEHGETEQKPPTEKVAVAPTADETLKLKPYGQVMEEKANKMASEKTAEAQPEGGAVPVESGAQPKTEEKPKVTYGYLMAENMGFIPKGTVDRMTAPKEFNQGTPEHTAQGGVPAAPTQGGVPTSPLTKLGAPASTPTGKDAFNARIKQFDADYQSLMDKAAATNDPQYAEQASRVKESKLAYEKAHPWGSPESAHPGILGKLGHIGEMVAARSPIIAPIVNSIPGSEGARAQEAASAQGETKAASEQNVSQEAVDAKTAKELGGTATPEQIADYQSRIKAIAGLSPEAAAVYAKVPAGTTGAELDKRFNEATNLTKMSDEQQRTTTAEQDRKDRAAEQKSQHEQTRQDKLSKAFYTYTTTDPKTGKITTEMTTGDKLDELPDDAQLLPVKDPSLLIGEARSMNAVQDSLNELHKDLHDHPEVFDNTAARSIVQTTTEQMNRVAATMLVAGTGGSIPLPSGLGDLINTALQNNALDDKTAKAVKNYIADYKAAKDKAMVIQMMMQNGKMGRGGQQAFESIVNQLPGGSTPDTNTAMRQMASLQRVLTGLNTKYPDKYADYTKTEPYAVENAAPEDTAAGEAKAAKAAPKAAAKPATKGGYSPNNPFAPKPAAPPQP